MSRALRVRDAVSAQAARAEHDAVRAELDARDDSFRDALQAGRALLKAEHPNSTVSYIQSLAFFLTHPKILPLLHFYSYIHAYFDLLNHPLI